MDLKGDTKKCKLKKSSKLYYKYNTNEFITYDKLPNDDRYIKSGIDDIDGGDTFAEYTSYFFETYGDELFDDI